MYFCMAEFVKAVKKALSKPVSNEDLVNLLIGEIVGSLSLKNQNGEVLYLSKSAVSKLMNNRAEVPVQLRSALGSGATSIEQLEETFTRVLLPRMVSEKIEAVCREIYTAISKDESVPEVFFSEIQLSLGLKDYGRLLAAAFRCSLIVSNKRDIIVGMIGEKSGTMSDAGNDRRMCAFSGTPAKDSQTYPLNTMLDYLKDTGNWIHSDSTEKDVYYYKYAPEYTIEHSLVSDGVRSGYAYYSFAHCNTIPYWADIRLMYHQTMLSCIGGVLLDGGRYFTSCPEWGRIPVGEGKNKAIIYKFIIKDSTVGIVHSFYYNDKDPEERNAHNEFINSILVFDDEKEQKRFEAFAFKRWNKVTEYDENWKIPRIEGVSEKAEENFKQQFRTIRRLQYLYQLFVKSEISA